MIFAIPTDTCYWFACNIYNESSYIKIFEFKNRGTNKILSIAVKNFLELELISKLNSSQIDFLKKYPFPFTIITEMNDNFNFPSFLDRNLYKNFGIRIAENFLTEEINEVIEFPIFLTSANNSNEKEIYDSFELRKKFNTDEIVIFDWESPKKLTSNIFEFIWETTEMNFVRKNY